jgi:hypothetical protein
MPLIVSETITRLYPEYTHTIGEPLEVTQSDYAEQGEVALIDDDEIVLVPVLYTVPAE